MILGASICGHDAPWRQERSDMQIQFSRNLSLSSLETKTRQICCRGNFVFIFFLVLAQQLNRCHGEDHQFSCPVLDRSTLKKIRVIYAKKIVVLCSCKLHNKHVDLHNHKGQHGSTRTLWPGNCSWSRTFHFRSVFLNLKTINEVQSASLMLIWQQQSTWHGNPWFATHTFLLCCFYRYGQKRTQKVYSHLSDAFLCFL